jgi:putative FmdB family regulatory protein
MPAYEYKCVACDHRFELRQKMSDAPIESCPECGGDVKRLISGGAGAISKGSSYSDAASACGFDGPCCGGGGACGNGMCSED